MNHQSMHIEMRQHMKNLEHKLHFSFPNASLSGTVPSSVSVSVPICNIKYNAKSNIDK